MLEGYLRLYLGGLELLGYRAGLDEKFTLRIPFPLLSLKIRHRLIRTFDAFTLYKTSLELTKPDPYMSL
jgi:hypothetical protein